MKKGQKMNKKTYNTNEIFEIINKAYDLGLSFQRNKAEIEAIKRKIRRELTKHGVKKPYKANIEQINYLIYGEMKPYLLKQAIKYNPNILEDISIAKERANTGQPQNYVLSYGEALINIKLEHLIHSIKPNDFFKAPKFEEDYTNYIKHIDAQGYPKIGYSKAIDNLTKSDDYFKEIPGANNFFKNKED